MMISLDISKCTGCRTCETVCTFYHTGRINRNLARIRVVNIFETGIDFPAQCIQCQERYCADCPSNAITIGNLGQIIVSPTVCTLCGICEKKCPIGAINIFNDFVYVCDLCGGEPKCVENCTENAITYNPENKDLVSLAEIVEKTKKMNPSEKRMLYAEKMGADLRKTWMEK